MLDDLADRLGYAPATIATALNVLRRLGKVRSRGYVWELTNGGGSRAKTLD